MHSDVAKSVTERRVARRLGMIMRDRASGRHYEDVAHCALQQRLLIHGV